MKISGYKCDNCGTDYMNKNEIIGIKSEHSIFETALIFESRDIDQCAAHVCQNCMKEHIENPIAYLKGRDRALWEVKRAELSALLRFRIVSSLKDKGAKK